MLVLKDDPTEDGAPPRRPWKVVAASRLVALAFVWLAIGPVIRVESPPLPGLPEVTLPSMPVFSLPKLPGLPRLPSIRLPRMSRPAPGGDKTPLQTWRAYGPIFRRHARGPLTPEFLAALAQTESSGNPQARPGTWYARPTSAAGLMQMTEGNFRTASRVAPPEFGRSRLDPDDAVELTSHYLDFEVRRVLAGRKVSPRHAQQLAAVVHLCGPGRGPDLVRARFEPQRLGSCGAQAVGPYVRVIMRRSEDFRVLAAAG